MHDENEINERVPTNTQEIWLHDINEEAALYFHERAMYSIQTEPEKPIVVFINSYGGEQSAMFQILDTMDIVREMSDITQTFITCAMGKAMSAGAVILAYGDLRLASSRSNIMLHQSIVISAGGPIQDMDIEMRVLKEGNKKMLEILRDRCNPKLSLKDLKAKLERNTFMTPKQALKFGLIDAIGYPKVVTQSLYDIYVLGPEARAARAAEHAAMQKAAHEAGVEVTCK